MNPVDEVLFFLSERGRYLDEPVKVIDEEIFVFGRRSFGHIYENH